MRCIKMETSNYRRLQENLEYLKLKQIGLHLNAVLDANQTTPLSFIDTLLKLTDYEREVKEHNVTNAMIKVAAFPHLKTLNDFDFAFQEAISKDQILDLSSLRFLEKQENIVFQGSSGVGKTHLAISIGIIAAQNRNSTYFIKCHDLIQNLKAAHAENRLEAKLKTYAKYRVLIIDEIGYLPLAADDAKMFFQLIDKRYEKKSTIFTTNASFQSWIDIFQGPMIANAIVDRVLHHAMVINIVGHSYRLKNHLQQD